ncbi:glutathione S-transferase family protein [Roseovarius sp. 2305UL8-3]|uniref:glutathione S-transferase family protein n=1 Tax=Roseovarius conchicola TaxID=3121636 RepID=UPI003529831C
MYEVIGKRATRALRVLWMLEEIGQPYQHIPAAPRSDEAVAVNPSGKVPVLRVDDAIITDSTAILTYLGDRHGALSHPAGTVERAHQDALTQQILDDIESLLWAAARHSFIMPEEHRVPALKPTLKWEYQRNLARLSDQLVGPFLMGDAMTIPDILLTHCLRWAAGAKFPEPDAKLADYLNRMEGRPAFQTAVALP